MSPVTVNETEEIFHFFLGSVPHEKSVHRDLGFIIGKHKKVGSGGLKVI
jgi:hypothetical protein